MPQSVVLSEEPMLALALISLAAAAEAKPVVSVLYFENRAQDPQLEALKKGFADMLITDLVAWDGVTVVERNRLEDVLKELKLQQSKAFDKSTAVKVGKLIGAQYTVTGSLLLADGRLRVDAVLTRVATSEVVASASAADAPDKIFDVEQQLVEALTQAIDWKLKNRDARKKAKVPSFEALVAYSRALDLSDQGKVDEAQKAMAAVVSKSPTFLLARERKQELLEKLKEFEARKKDLIGTSALELGRRADEELKKNFASLSLDEKKMFVFWRMTKARFLARLLKQHLSSRETSFRVVRPGQEAKALAVMTGWAENFKSLIEETSVVEKAEPSASIDIDRLPQYELIRDSGLWADEGSPRVDRDRLIDLWIAFVIKGELSDGAHFSVAPPLSEQAPAELDRALELLTQGQQRAEAAYQRATDKARMEWPLARACLARAEALEFLRRDEEAAAAYQKLLDLLPTSDAAGRAETKIQEIIGVKHSNARSDREKFEVGRRVCDDFYVNAEADWRLRRKGLPGLDEITKEMEDACAAWPGLGMEWGRFYRALASDAARHDDCERAKRYWLKAFTFGSEGPRSFEPYFKNESWCQYGLTEATFPWKVSVHKVNEGTRGNATAEALSEGLVDLLGEELGARGVSVQLGGGGHGGVLGLYASLSVKSATDPVQLTGKLGLFDDGTKDIELAAPVGDSIDLDAFFAPALRVLWSKGKSEPGPRKPTSKLPTELAVGYGRAMKLFNDRKWREATDAFSALQKKYPTFRLAAVRAKWAAAKAEKQ